MLLARPLSMTPRTGRSLQRYSQGGERLVAGAVPFYQGRVVLVSSQSGNWVLPKGGWEEDESAQEAAAREAYEEAGVLGTIKHALPEVRFASKKSGAPCRMTLFVMDVEEGGLLEQWPEAQERRRRLFTIEEAMEITKPEMRAALGEMMTLGLHLPFVPPASLKNNSSPCGSCEGPASVVTAEEEDDDDSRPACGDGSNNAFITPPPKRAVDN